MVTPATTASALRIAFIGFGEVGQRFATDLRRHPRVSVAAFDRALVVPDARTPAIRAAIEALGVSARDTCAGVCTGADVVVSAVTADQAEAVAREAAGALGPGQMFLDVNSASPATKRRAAMMVTPSGARYVECAVMAAVKAPGLAVPILAGGPAASDAATLLNPLGMKLSPIATEFGRASAIKLCRSIMIKGLETLIGDCARASSHWGVEKQVYASLAETFPSVDWAALATTMGERVATHGVRRSAEMNEAADMLAEIGLEPTLARAVAQAQLRGAAGGKAGPQ
jgi:3-hydroxyisobutyrate dehydrogenase-like beta-hydroxyacid dehydrogenase